MFQRFSPLLSSLLETIIPSRALSICPPLLCRLFPYPDHALHASGSHTFSVCAALRHFSTRRTETSINNGRFEPWPFGIQGTWQRDFSPLRFSGNWLLPSRVHIFGIFQHLAFISRSKARLCGVTGYSEESMLLVSFVSGLGYQFQRQQKTGDLLY